MEPEDLIEILKPSREKLETFTILAAAFMFAPVIFNFPFSSLPLPIYSQGTVTCMAIGCPEPTPSRFNPVSILVDAVFWYIFSVAGLEAFRRWIE